jgi:hypothetical protein
MISPWFFLRFVKQNFSSQEVSKWNSAWPGTVEIFLITEEYDMNDNLMYKNR